MSQHDMVLDNQSGASFRADANNMAQALASTSKGNTRPATVYAGQLWLDDNTPSTTVWSVYWWDGTHDIKMGELNTTTGMFMPFVNGSALSALYALLNSPAFTGTPTAPTPAAGDNSTKLATTAFVLANSSSAAVQQVYYETGAVASGTGTFTLNDSAPTSSNGDEYLTLSITPKSATNVLEIEVDTVVSNSSSGQDMFIGLFQDSGSSAIAANAFLNAANSHMINTPPLRHQMVAGTTSATTFRVRIGATGGTTTLNGISGSRIFGGLLASSIRITEWKP